MYHVNEGIYTFMCTVLNLKMMDTNSGLFIIGRSDHEGGRAESP